MIQKTKEEFFYEKASDTSSLFTLLYVSVLCSYPEFRTFAQRLLQDSNLWSTFKKQVPTTLWALLVLCCKQLKVQEWPFDINVELKFVCKIAQPSFLNNIELECYVLWSQYYQIIQLSILSRIILLWGAPVASGLMCHQWSATLMIQLWPGTFFCSSFSISFPHHFLSAVSMTVKLISEMKPF